MNYTELMSIRVTQTGHEKAIADLTNIVTKLKTAPTKALAEVGKVGEEQAKRVVPVKTGRLQGSIKAQASGMTLTLGGYTNYAAFVELGTSRMPARPYIMPGMNMAWQQLPRALHAAFGF